MLWNEDLGKFNQSCKNIFYEFRGQKYQDYEIKTTMRDKEEK
jgi:hypothetical protein